MTLTDYLEGLAADGAVDWTLERDALNGAGLSVDFHVCRGETDTHTETLGTEVYGPGWYFRLTDRVVTDDALGNRDVRFSWGDAKAVLDMVPCFVMRHLPVEVRGAVSAALRWGHTPLIPAGALLSSAAAAAEAAGFSVSFDGVSGGAVRIPFSGSGATVGQVIDSVARWLPNLTLRVAGRNVDCAGGAGVPQGARATGRVYTSPDMKVGTLTVGSTVVDLAEVYERNARQVEPLNWFAHHAGLIAEALAFCAEAYVQRAGNVLYLTAREPGAAGNLIPLSLAGVVAADTAATAGLALPDDLGAAGVLTDGVNSVELDEAGAFATGYLVYNVPGGQGFTVGGQFLAGLEPDEALSVDAWNAQLRAAGCPVVCVSADASPSGDEVTVNIRALVRGAAGNDITLDPDAGNSVSGPTLTGGSSGRTVGDLVEAINDETDFPFTAAAQGTAASGSAVFNRAFTSARVTVSLGGVRLAQVTLSGFDSGAEGLATAINGNSTLAGLVHAVGEGSTLTLEAAQRGEAANGTVVEVIAFSLPALNRTVTLAGGVDGEGILLTAKVAGSAGNDLNVRADGCFGYAGAFQGGADASGIVGRVVPFSGGSGGGGYVPAGGKIGTRSTVELDTSGWVVTRRSVSQGEGKCVPPCVILMQRNRIVHRIPAGASEYAPGALIVDVPFNPDGGESFGVYGEAYEPERLSVREVVRESNKRQERDKDWMLVKGSPLPAGWVLGTAGVRLDRAFAGPREKWRRFWAQFGAFKRLADLGEAPGAAVPAWAVGQPVFFPVDAAAAYPPEDAPVFEESRVPLGRPLAPATRETSNVPANYKVLGPGDNVHLLVEGSFPASSKAGANVGGLRFCKGCLMQYFFVGDAGNVTGWTRQELDEFFEGTCEINGVQVRYTCLKVEGVFINRRKKRFQVGTNRQAPGDPDFNEDRDGGTGWFRIGEVEEEEELSAELGLEDYVQAAEEYWRAAQDAGADGSVQVDVARVRGFNADATLDDVFAALGLEGVQGSMSYSAAAGRLSVSCTGSQRDALGIDDFLQRIQAEKQERWLEQYEREFEELEGDRREDEQGAPDWGAMQEEKEKRSYPMVSPSIQASKGVEKAGRPLNPFQVFMEGNTVYINGGVLPVPGGAIYCDKKEIPTSLWQNNRHFYVKAEYDRAEGKWVARYKYHDKPEDE